MQFLPCDIMFFFTLCQYTSELMAPALCSRMSTLPAFHPLCLFASPVLPLFPVSNYSFINSIRETISCVIGQLAWGSGALSSFITNMRPNWRQKAVIPSGEAPFQRAHLDLPDSVLHPTFSSRPFLFFLFCAVFWISHTVFAQSCPAPDVPLP